MRRVRHPDRRKFARAQKFGEHDCIAPVSLDSVADCPWNEAGSYHVAEVTGFHDLPVDPITAAASFVAQMQRRAAPAEFLEQLRNRNGRVVDRTVAQHLAVAPVFRYGNGNFGFVNVETDKPYVWHISS